MQCHQQSSSIGVDQLLGDMSTQIKEDKTTRQEVSDQF